MDLPRSMPATLMANDQVNLEQTDVTTELYKAVIGHRNQDYYLRRFAKFDADGKISATWHWPAFFTTLNWLIFRKMWGVAIWFATLAVAVALAVFGLGRLAFNYSDSTEQALMALFLLAAFILPALYANAVYYRFCEKKITRALASDSGVQGACELLAKQASTSRRWMGLALLNLTVIFLISGAMTMVPGFNFAEKTESSTPIMQSSSIGVVPQTAPAAETPRVMPSEAPVSAVEGVKACPDCPPGAATASADQASAPGTEEVTGKTEQADTANKPVAAEAPTQTERASKKEPKGRAAKTGKADATASPAAPSVNASRQGGGNTAAVSADKPALRDAYKPDRRYFIQVGAYAQDKNARNVLAKLEAIGLPAFTQPVQAKGVRLIRIRVGPFNSKAEADKALAKIKELDFPFAILTL